MTDREGGVESVGTLTFQQFNVGRAIVRKSPPFENREVLFKPCNIRAPIVVIDHTHVAPGCTFKDDDLGVICVMVMIVVS